jgi:hypothetical protein
MQHMQLMQPMTAAHPVGGVWGDYDQQQQQQEATGTAAALPNMPIAAATGQWQQAAGRGVPGSILPGMQAPAAGHFYQQQFQQ